MGKNSTAIEKLSKTALLAGAAIALPSAHAGVIYSGSGSGFDVVSTSTDTTVDLDVDGDGTNDFSFTASYANETDSVTALGSDMWLGTAGSSPGAPAMLAAGVEIGSDSSSAYSFFSGTGTLQSTETLEYSKMQGPWPTDGMTTAYLGLEFNDGGPNTYYGWVQLSACTPENFDSPPAPCDDPSADINVVDWAYQSTPGVGILSGQTSDTPEPSSLALFALGAAGLAAFRLRRKQAA